MRKRATFSGNSHRDIFKLVFFTILGIIIVALILQILLVQGWTCPDSNRQNIIDSLGFTWKAGIFAIFGLIGGRNIA